MQFSSKQIKGLGRGHKVGFPTINLVVSTDLILDQGIYAAWIEINNITYKGALHYGVIPTFNQTYKTMEVYLLDITDESAPLTEDKVIIIDIIEKLRDIKKFANIEELASQITEDVKNVRLILK